MRRMLMGSVVAATVMLGMAGAAQAGEVEAYVPVDVHGVLGLYVGGDVYGGVYGDLDIGAGLGVGLGLEVGLGIGLCIG